ncbi:MAG: alpha/beta hydrolase [Candidatus Bathyarchaeota archaeon]|nr:alpha/beta hydrolase [Candidatus Bathyarchaeota archaeon]
MPEVQVNDIKLYYEITGEGTPVVFVHEFAGDFSSWELQVRFFSRRYRVVAYNARGYPPSSVLEDPSSYSQDFAVNDLAGIIDTLGLAPCHVIGLSMGAYAALHLGLRHPKLVRSIVVAGCGYGSDPEERKSFQLDSQKIANLIETEGMEEFVKVYSAGPTRIQLKKKNPRGYAEFEKKLLTHSPKGLANTLRGIQAARPSVYDLDGLEKMKIPMLILTGDEDWPCLKPNLFLKKKIQTAAMSMAPNSGHTINLEEPELFNKLVQDFLIQVDSGQWPSQGTRLPD